MNFITKSKRRIAFFIIVVLLTSIHTTSAQQDLESTIEQISPENSLTPLEPFPDDSGISVTSIENPVKSQLNVAAYSYAAPNPSTGHRQEQVPKGTNVWVVEKVYCSYDGKYYYYAGYTYNNESHRGYFCEDVVYRNGSKYLPSSIVNETKPAGLKTHTSLAGTVYDGPDSTSYSVTGSVESESIKLIRTEGDYNFIEYTVTATGKLKRGFLHYSKITGSWATLSSQAANKINGKTFYIRNTESNNYLGVATGNNARYSTFNIQFFSGNPTQIFKITYDSAGKFFYIQPANCYTVNRRCSITTTTGIPHADKNLIINNSASVKKQRFWIVKREGVSNGYKIVPVSSYGTMTLSQRNTNQVKQFYTDTSSALLGRDVWVFEKTEKYTSATRYEQEKDQWCWVASAKTAASSETPFNSSTSQTNAVTAIKNANVNEPGTISQMAAAANYFMDRNKDSGNFVDLENQYYSEYTIRKFIAADHTLILAMQYENTSNNSTAGNNIVGNGHAITLVGFMWIDCQGYAEAPGYYEYYFYDPGMTATSQKQPVYYEYLLEYSSWVTSSPAIWNDSVAYSTDYVYDTITYTGG